MQLPIFLAYTCDSAMHPVDLNHRLSVVEEFYGIDHREGWRRDEKIVGVCGLVFWDIENAAINIPLSHVRRDSLSISAYFPYGVTSLASKSEVSSGGYISVTLKSVRERGDLLTTLNPPLAMASIDSQTCEMLLLNDSIGFGRIYEFKSGPWTIWTNRLALGPIFSGAEPEADEQAWSTLFASGWFLGNLTAYKDATILPPGTMVKVNTLTGSATHRRVADLGVMLSEEVMPSESDLDEVERSLLGFFEESALFTSAPLSFGLSGGRDSRLITAYGITVRDDIKLHTAFPPNLEVEIAEQLISKSPRTLNWRKVDRLDWSDKKPDADEMPLVEKAKRWIRLCDGDMMPSIYARPAPESTGSRIHSLRISGAAGEVAHANYYSLKDAPHDPSIRIDRYGKGLLQNHPLMHRHASSVGAEIYHSTMLEAESRNIRGFAKLDYWYIFSRLRRWASGNWGIEGALPLTSPAFLRAGFRQPIQEKFNSNLHRRLISRVAPFWSDVPFFYERMHEIPNRERTTGSALPTLWEQGRLDEYVALLSDHTEIEASFDHMQLVETYRNVPGTPKDGHPKLQNMAHRLLWRIGFSEHLKDVSAAARRSSETIPSYGLSSQIRKDR